MSQAYWKSLASESIDPDLLKEHNDLSDKLKEHFQMNYFFEEWSSKNAETPSAQKPKPVKAQKRMYQVPKHLKTREEAKMDRSPITPVVNKTVRKHRRSNTWSNKQKSHARKSYPDWEEYTVNMS